MNAIPIPHDHHDSSINWKQMSGERNYRSKGYSETAKVLNGLWDEVLKTKIETITTPPDNIRLRREIEDILDNCSQPDWDGYNAKPIERISIEYSWQFIKLLPGHISYPDLVAEPDGNISMIWRKNGYHLIVSIDKDRNLVWGGTGPGRSRIYGVSEFKESIPNEITDLLLRVEG